VHRGHDAVLLGEDDVAPGVAPQSGLAGAYRPISAAALFAEDHASNIPPPELRGAGRHRRPLCINAAYFFFFDFLAVFFAAFLFLATWPP
jgi:hypothetical protein